MNIIKVAWRQFLKMATYQRLWKNRPRSNRPVVRYLEVRSTFELIRDEHDISPDCCNQAALKTLETEIFWS